MTKEDETPATAPGSPSVSVRDVMAGATQNALREGLHEMGRAEGRRGSIHLSVVLNLGDAGVPTWVKSSLHFEAYRHHKDAREKS